MPDFDSAEGRYRANKLWHSLNAVGRLFLSEQILEEADALLGLCVALAQNLDDRVPAGYSGKLALSLDSHAMCLQAQGRFGDACIAKEDVVRIVSRLCERDSARYLATFACLLRGLAAYLQDAERTDDSREAAQAAVAHLKSLHAQDPLRYKPDYATALCEYSACPTRESLEGSEDQDSLGAASQSADLWKELYNLNPKKYESELAASLYALCSCMKRARKPTKQVDVITQAVALYKNLYQGNAGSYSYPLAMSLQSLGECHAQEGHIDLAINAEEEAIQILQYACDSGEKELESALDAITHIHQTHLAIAGRSGGAHSPTKKPNAVAPKPHDPNGADEQLKSAISWGRFQDILEPRGPARRLPRRLINEAVFRFLEIWNVRSGQQLFSETSKKGLLQPVTPLRDSGSDATRSDTLVSLPPYDNGTPSNAHSFLYPINSLRPPRLGTTKYGDYSVDAWDERRSVRGRRRYREYPLIPSEKERNEQWFKEQHRLRTKTPDARTPLPSPS